MLDLTTSVYRIFAVCIGLALSAGLMACDPDPASSCDDDSDCFSDEICEDGICWVDERDAGNGDEQDADNGDDAGNGGQGCEDEQLSCGGQCFDSQTDPDHCGSCDNRCEDEPGENEISSCINGTCHYACAAGFARCDGECVDDPGTCAVELAASGRHTCVRFDSGTVHCWGLNVNGQLGDGTTSDSRKNPVQVQGLTDAVAISAGAEHSCAIVESGEVKCWGSNDSGQLGHGGPTDGDESQEFMPVTVDGISSATAIATGSRYSCAVVDGGDVQCWGDNSSGQLGVGNVGQDSTTPVDVLQMSSAVDVSAGDNHTCARLDDGRVQCWGSNDGGQLGNGDEAHNSSLFPDDVNDLSTAIDIAVGTTSQAACAITADQSLYCWGENEHDILGEETDAETASPVKVHDFSSVAQVGVGTGTASGSFICVRLDDGQVHCWGAAHFGKLGDGGSGISNPDPVQPQSLGPTIELAVGDDHVCAITEGDEFNERDVKCWGDNFDGQLGDGTWQNSRNTPVSVVW